MRMTSRQRVWVLLVVLQAASLAGCAGTGRPRFFNPPSIERQRQNASLHDPYPERDLGPDTGMRPRDYNREVAEPNRAWWKRLGGY